VRVEWKLDEFWAARGALGNFAFRLACVAGTLAGSGLCDWHYCWVATGAGLDATGAILVATGALDDEFLSARGASGNVGFLVGFVAGTRPGSWTSDWHGCGTASGALLAAAGANLDEIPDWQKLSPSRKFLLNFSPRISGVSDLDQCGLAQSVSGTRPDAAGAISGATGAILGWFLSGKNFTFSRKFLEFFSLDFWLILVRWTNVSICGL
jgi:hypothetical protein